MVRFTTRLTRHTEGMLVCLLLSYTGGFCQGIFTIHGQLGKDRHGLIRVTYFTNGHNAVDSAEVKDGRFELTGKLSEPSEATIVLNPLYGRITREQYYSQDALDLYVEAGDIQLRSDSGLKAATIRAGQSQADYQAMTAQHRLLDDQEQALVELANKYQADKNDSGLQRLVGRMADIRARRKDTDSAFIYDHPNSYVAMNLFMQNEMGVGIDLPVVQPLFDRFLTELQRSFAGKILAKRIALAKNLDHGKPAMNFTLPDTSGNYVSLSSAKGKYVLLCFWGRSGPDYNKVLTEVYRQFGDRNFTLFSVSYHHDYGSWLRDLEQRPIPGIHVIDLDGINDHNIPVSEAAKAYDLNFVVLPQCLLLDPAGFIVARNLAIDPSLPGKIGMLMNGQK